MAIKWRLNVLMAERRMTNKDLGDRIGRHEVSVSRLRSRDYMPRLDGDELDALCGALDFDTPCDKSTGILAVVYVGDKSTRIDALLVKGLSLTSPSASAAAITATAP